MALEDIGELRTGHDAAYREAAIFIVSNVLGGKKLPVS